MPVFIRKQIVFMFLLHVPRIVTPLWSPWTSWSECSRTCGGGASFARRRCVNVTEEECSGDYVKYRSCKNQGCDGNKEDFRAMQCSAFNDTTYDGKLYEWIPEMSEERAPCALYCRAKGTDIIVLLSPTVVDGTRCYRDSYDMCINGECMSVGCDRQLGSGKRLDVCGVCDGDGSSCRLVTGLYRSKPDKSTGTEVVITIPQKSRHISVSERGSGHVGLMLNNSANIDVIMPDSNQHTREGVMERSGLKVRYGHLSYGKEYFDVPGPVPEDMKILAVYDETVWKYIRYEFYRPLEFIWVHVEAGVVCSATCGGGLQFIWPICVRISDGSRSDNKYCHNEGLTPPAPKVHRCNNPPCPPVYVEERITFSFENIERARWLPDPWTRCSASCDGGFQTRSITCVRELANGDVLPTVNDSPCQGAGLHLPESRRSCNEHPCPMWEAKQWSECSVTCGSGWRYRVVRCLSHNGNPGFNCDPLKKPQVKQSCLIRKACILEEDNVPMFVSDYESNEQKEKAAFVVQEVNSISRVPSWVAGNWGGCSVSCGVGVTTREVTCRVLLAFSLSVETLADAECDSAKPESSKRCSMGECPKVADDDSHGTYDASVDDVEYDIVDDLSVFEAEDIDSNYRVENTNDTYEYSFEDFGVFEWRFTQYGSCSPSCGSGTQRSIQQCYHIESNALAADDRCDANLKVSPRTRPCGNEPCIIPSQGGRRWWWELGPFSDCDVMCGRGRQNRSVVCREMAEGFNNSSPHHYRPHGRRMPDMMCPAPKPPEAQACSQTACPPEWIPQPWSKCSRNCGRGVQNRTSQCMQKLGTGEVSRVAEHYCSRRKPPSRQPCNMKNCSPRYAVEPWSSCLATCGISLRTRPVVCMQVKAKRTKAKKVPLRMCSNLKMPPRKKTCKMPKCAGSHPRELMHTSNLSFTQQVRQDKVRLIIGQKATVFEGTTVVIKCRVDGFERENIQWRHNGREVGRKKRRINVLPDGSLRVAHARLSDSGVFFCIAWPSSARSLIKVVSGISETSTRPNVSPSSEFDLLHQENPNRAHPSFGGKVRVNETDDDPHVLPTDPVEIVLEPRRPRFRPRPHFIVTTVESPPLVVRPGISYVNARPPLEVNFRGGSRAADLIGSNQFYKYAPPSTQYRGGAPFGYKPTPDLIPSIFQYLSETGQDNTTGPIGELLQRYIETVSSNERDLVTEEEMNNIVRDILSRLTDLIENDADHVTPRGNTARSTDAVSLQKIIRLLEERVEPDSPPTYQPATIDRQPTSSPRQLERDVVAYVGGNLIVAGAERVTILCEASGNPKPKITWYRDGTKLPEHRRQFVLPDDSLRLLYLQFSDAGTYMCVASNRYGNDSQTTALSVMQKPRILSTTRTLEDFTSDVLEVTVGAVIRAKLGARIIIKCPTESYPEVFVEWRKDGPGMGSNTKVLADNSIEIYPTTPADQGVFSCEASNPAGSDYQASPLVLIDPPHISNELNARPDIDGAIGLPELLMTGIATESHRVKANSSVMMGCPVTGFPDPQITWLFNSRPIQEMGRILDYQLMKQDKVLQIPNAGLEAEGMYTCHAHNDGGNLTTRLELTLIVYTYQFGELTTCSASCGDTGLQYRRLKCMQDGIAEVDEWYCTGVPRPVLNMQLCNRVDCPPRFAAGPWGSCSVSCGNGTRTRASSCVILMSDGSTREVAAEACLRYENRTMTSEPCFEERCPDWRAGPWRSCSHKCIGRGVGGKTRRIYCVTTNGTKLHPKHCRDRMKPRRKMACPNPRCEPVWVTSRWSVCSKKCGRNGYKTRVVNCVYRGRKGQPAGNQCSIRRTPKIKLPCNVRLCARGNQPKSTSSASGRCLDRFWWCPRARRAGRCKLYGRFCCKSCRR